VITSIHSRILLSAFVVLILFLGLTGIVLDKAFRSNVESAQRENLRTQIYTLLATAELSDEDGRLTLPEEITEPRLNLYESNLHARVVTTENKVIWQSKSMLNTNIPFPAQIEVGKFTFSNAHNHQQYFTLLSFATLWVTDKGEQSYIFQVAENQQALNKQTTIFRKNLWGWLAGVSFLLIIIQGYILRWGLKPLRHVADDLLDIEKGKKKRLTGKYAKEINPLTNNLNQLLDSSQQQLSRYRDALGNMAHSLKTPIAVLQGIIDNTAIEQKDTASEQLSTINSIVEYQLQRAATVGHQQLGDAIDLRPLAEKIISTLDKVHKDKQVKTQLDITHTLKTQADEGDLFELLGNLIENAFKWCNKQVRVSAKTLNTQTQIIIEDDGPGIDKAEQERILLRGQRADQQTPGHGLGLAMVNDMLLLYKGSIKITQSDLGGAKIIVKI